MRRAVPALVGVRVAQAKIGGQVDDVLRQSRVTGRSCPAPPRAAGPGRARPWLDLVGIAEFQRRALAQVGMHLVDVLAQVAARGDLAHLDLGMPEQQAQQLAAGVAGAADDRRPDHGLT